MAPVVISELRSLPAYLSRARLGWVFSITVSRVWVWALAIMNAAAIRAPGGKARHSLAESRLQVT